VRAAFKRLLVGQVVRSPQVVPSADPTEEQLVARVSAALVDAAAHAAEEPASAGASVAVLREIASVIVFPAPRRVVAS